MTIYGEAALLGAVVVEEEGAKRFLTTLLYYSSSLDLIMGTWLSVFRRRD
jgi:hypothetical protein